MFSDLIGLKEIEIIEKMEEKGYLEIETFHDYRIVFVKNLFTVIFFVELSDSCNAMICTDYLCGGNNG